MSDETQNDEFSVNGSPFPDENVHPSIKAHPKYILQYAKAMYYQSNRFGHMGSLTDEEYDTLMEVAQGNLSVDGLRKMFGFAASNSEEKEANIAYIDVKILNFATKYINRAVAKMTANHYDVQLEAIDPVSVRKKENYQTNVKAWYEYKDWITEMGGDPKEFFPDLDVSVLPEFPDELMFEMLTGEKVKEAVDAELGIKLLHEINDFAQTRRMLDRFIACIGKGHIHCYRDGNGIPREELIDPKLFIGSYVDREDFKGQEYAGFFDFPTVSQFRKEAEGWIPEEEIDNIISQFSNQNLINNTTYPGGVHGEAYDGLNYIPVMRFYFLSEDKRAYVKKKTKIGGNDTLFERAWAKGSKLQKPTEDEMPFLIKNEYTSVYGGVWVLDTDFVYNYGIKDVGRSNLVDAQLPIISHAPNMHNGKVVSFLSQIIEPLYMANVSWNKIKEILAKGWMGIMEIDFNELENIALGSGGKKWTPKRVLQHFKQTNQLIKRGATNKYDQRYSNGAISVQSNGLSFADYFSTFFNCIQVLEGMVGTAAAESLNTPDRLAVRVAQMSASTGDLDMEYLYNADESIYRRVSHQMLLLLQEAKRDGVGIQGFIQALGHHFAVPEDIAYCDFGLIITREPTPEEWAEFFASLMKSVEKGQITALDEAYIREVKNLKKARIILGQRIKINERKAMQMAQANNQMAIESNTAATEAKKMADQENILLDDQLERARNKEMAKLEQENILLKNELEARNIAQTNKSKEKMSKQKSVDELIKEAGKNQTTKTVEMIKASAASEKEFEKE